MAVTGSDTGGNYTISCTPDEAAVIAFLATLPVQSSGQFADPCGTRTWKVDGRTFRKCQTISLAGSTLIDPVTFQTQTKQSRHGSDR